MFRAAGFARQRRWPVPDWRGGRSGDRVVGGRQRRFESSGLPKVALFDVYITIGNLKCGFSIKPIRLPKGSVTVATLIPPPTSSAGAATLAPAATKCLTAASNSATRQYATLPPGPALPTA